MALTRAEKADRADDARIRVEGRAERDPPRLQGAQRAPGDGIAPPGAGREGPLPGGEEHARPAGVQGHGLRSR